MRHLGATDYWMWYEWQHRGSPHVHGLAWLPDAPDVERTLGSTNDSQLLKEQLIHYINSLVTTINPAVLADGSNVDQAPLPLTNSNICNMPYPEFQNLQEDLRDLVATCRRHTHSPAYCLRTHGDQLQASHEQHQIPSQDQMQQCQMNSSPLHLKLTTLLYQQFLKRRLDELQDSHKYHLTPHQGTHHQSQESHEQHDPPISSFTELQLFL